MAPVDAIPWLELVGRYHVLAVHFPIALLTVGAALALLDSRRSTPGRSGAAQACLAIGAAGAVAAALLGWLHAEHVSFGGAMQRTLEAHRWWGTSAALFAVATLAFGWAAGGSAVARRMRRASIALAAIAVAIAGHLGGSLAYGPDYFWPFGRGEADDAAPPPSSTRSEPPAPVAPLEPAADPVVDFAREVRPILEDRCFGCHGERKQKGKLRLDRVASLFGTREDGPVVAPGDPAASVLYQRVTLPADHDDRMPSEGEPLTPEQIEILRKWIAEGASVGAAEVGGGVAQPDADVQEAVMGALRSLHALGAIAGPLSQESDALGVDFHLLGASVTDDHVELLAPLAPALAELNLARTSITDAALAVVAELAALERLDLSNTAVGDVGVARLTALAKLEVLNLHGTRLGDAGLAALSEMAALKRVYVWRTAVTNAGAADFAARRPDVRLVRGEAGE
jgi:hypothetical protein